jgi:hypothetical protein
MVTRLTLLGSFTPDGNGGIAIAAVDYNGFANGPERLQASLAASSYAFSSSTERQFLTWPGTFVQAGVTEKFS